MIKGLIVNVRHSYLFVNLILSTFTLQMVQEKIRTDRILLFLTPSFSPFFFVLPMTKCFLFF
jgi:hypothetical protein